MSMGMSRDEYWNGDIFSAFDYLEAERQRQKRFDEQAWLQGMYICDAVAVAVNNTACMALVGSKGEKMSYPDRPYNTQLTEEEKEVKEEKETLQAKLWMEQFVQVGKKWGNEDK